MLFVKLFLNIVSIIIIIIVSSSSRSSSSSSSSASISIVVVVIIITVDGQVVVDIDIIIFSLFRNALKALIVYFFPLYFQNYSSNDTIQNLRYK